MLTPGRPSRRDRPRSPAGSRRSRGAGPPRSSGRDVLDPHDGDAKLTADAAEHLGRVVHLPGIEPAQALIGEEELGLGGERARQLELLEATRAQERGGGSGIPRQAHEGEYLSGLSARFCLRVAGSRAEMGGDGDVLQDGKLAEGTGDLKGARDAAMADGVRGQAADLVTEERDGAARG